MYTVSLALITTVLKRNEEKHIIIVTIFTKR